MGAPAEGFAFDNERPRHQAFVPAFAIARRPVSNATWMHFVEGGGYERREWWSDEGWAWKEEYDITHPEGWTADGPRDHDDHRPVLHVSWFEADALARSHGARLPSEAEWERAATWTRDPLQDTGHVWEWTSTWFHGYPGFRAHPYREYSEVFFGEDYRVLRGASWATSERVRSLTFRNWDLPLRRQIFAGVRLAKDVT
jgi:iron(II)-dependent oxidoreductase